LPAIETSPSSAGEVVCAERDQLAVGGYDGYAATSEPLQIEVFCILEGHRGYSETSHGNLLEKDIQVKRAFGTGHVRAAPTAGGILRQWKLAGAWGCGWQCPTARYGLHGLFDPACADIDRTAAITIRRSHVSQSTFSREHICGVEGTVGVFASWRGKVAHLEKSFCLFLEASHQFRKGKATFVVRLFGKAAKKAHRLKMNAPHRRSQLQGLPHYGPDRMGVYPSHEGGNEDDSEACLTAMPDGLEFLGEESSSSQGTVDIITGPVELKKGCRETCVPELFSIVPVRSKAKTVRIDLDEGIPYLSCDFNDLWKVVP
jgi:hypothetical protein